MIYDELDYVYYTNDLCISRLFLKMFTQGVRVLLKKNTTGTGKILWKVVSICRDTVVRTVDFPVIRLARKGRRASEENSATNCLTVVFVVTKRTV